MEHTQKNIIIHVGPTLSRNLGKNLESSTAEQFSMVFVRPKAKIRLISAT